MKHRMLALLAGVSLLVISPFAAGARPLIVNTQLSPGFDQAGLQAVGVPKPIIDPSGVRLSVVVNSIQDQPSDFAPGLSPGGRWVAVNVSVTNVGTIPFNMSADDFLLFSSKTNLIAPAAAPTDLQGQFADTTLNPGFTATGQVLYALPAGVILQAVMFQAPGMSQWLVAILNT